MIVFKFGDLIENLKQKIFCGSFVDNLLQCELRPTSDEKKSLKQAHTNLRELLRKLPKAPSDVLQ